MKKLVSVILATLLILSLFVPLTAVAADTDPFRIESTQVTYATLKEAVDAAVDGDTITMLKDYDVTNDGASNFWVKKAITIDGGGHKLYRTTNEYCFIISAAEGKTITLKNMELDTYRGFRLMGTGQTVVFDNVTATVSQEVFLNCQLYTVTGSANTTKINIINSTIKHAGITPAIAVYANYKYEVNLQNSSILSSNAQSNAGGGANQLKQTTTICNASGTLTLNVDGTSTIAAGRQVATANDATVQAICVSNADSAQATTVNLASGAKLQLTDVNGHTGKFFANIGSNTAPLTVNDNGAQYTVCKEVAAKGFALPSGVQCAAGETSIGYTDGEKLYKSGATYQNASATADVTFKGATYTTAEFANVAGAAIRLANDAYSPAIRFSATLPTTLYEQLAALDPTVSFGMVLANASTMTTAGDIQTATAKVEKTCTVWSTDTDAGTKKYNFALYNIPQANYETGFAATAFFTVTYADGTTATFYAAFNGTDNVRSLKQVAQAYYDAGNTTNTVVNTILGK